MPLESVSLSDGRLGEERVGLIDEGGVMELWEVVSIVEEDFPETSWTLCDALLDSEWKLAFERRLNCFKNDIVGCDREEKLSPGEAPNSGCG